MFGLHDKLQSLTYAVDRLGDLQRDMDARVGSPYDAPWHLSTGAAFARIAYLENIVTELLTHLNLTVEFREKKSQSYVLRTKISNYTGKEE